MNRASYNAGMDGLQAMGEMLQRRRMEKMLRQEAEERRGERGADRDFQERKLQAEMARWQAERGDRLRAEMEGVADRQLEREVEPIRAEQRNYDDQRAVVETRLTQAMKRRGELEGQIAEQRRLNWQMSPDNPANRPKPAAPAPTAKITRKDGDTTASYEVPMTDIGRALGGASGYQSPYADDIAGANREIAGQSAEIAGGDTRTGFLGMAKSRQGVIDKARNQRLQLQAMELQDMLEKGIIDQEEADRRAARLMPR